MSVKVDQKAYLQKYLSGSSGDKKKKKKKIPKGKGFKIIDDDIDLSKLRPLDGDDLDIFDEGEDAPQIAGIIDDRPEELKQLEALKTSSKWRVVSQDDGFNSKLQVQEIKKDIKETEKENELIFGKMYSDSEDEANNEAQESKKNSLPDKKNGSDNNTSNSKQRHFNKSSEYSKKRRQSSGSDQSPPRKSRQSPDRQKNRRESSPAKRQKYSESSRKTNSHNDSAEYSKKRRNSSDSDESPPRKRNKSPVKNRNKHKNDRDQSPPRNTRKSPERKRSRWAPLSPDKERHSEQNYQHKSSNNNNHRQGHTKNRHLSDADQSPPRQTRKSPEGSRRKNNYDSDQSLPRKTRKSPEKSRRQQNYDSDQSPPRKTRKSPERSRKKDNYDSDQSPPRKAKNVSDRNRNNDSPPPSNKKMARTLEGKMAGLQDARQLRQENDDFRRREDEVFNKMSDEVSGRNAKAVSRKGKRETSAERQKQIEKAERQKEIDEKYKKWSRGIKQIQDQEARVQEFMHESSKPLARHKGDRDLEMSLKEIERDGDPMLKYIKERKRERGELGPEKPSYKGSFPPNRFNIRPGYRWDGVDRSNGYEKKYFEQQSKRKAQEEEAYKWSTEDL